MRRMSESVMTSLRPLTGAEVLFIAVPPRGSIRTNRDESRERRGPVKPPGALWCWGLLRVLRRNRARLVLVESPKLLRHLDNIGFAAGSVQLGSATPCESVDFSKTHSTHFDNLSLGEPGKPLVLQQYAHAIE